MIKGTIRQRTHRYIFLVFMMALVFCLSVFPRLIPSIIVLTGFNWIVECAWFRAVPAIFREKKRLWVFLLSGIYFLYLAGLLWSDNISYAAFDLQVKLSLIVFPLLFAGSDLSWIEKKHIRWIFGAFVLGCLTGTLILLGTAGLDFYHSGETRGFFYTRLADTFHPSYLAMYLVFSIAILSRYIFLEYKTITPLKATLSALLMAYFFVVVFLLSSKAGIMGLGLIIFMQMVMVFSRRTLLKPGILIALISMLLFYLCFTMFSYTSSRFVKMQKAVAGDTGEMGNTRDGSSERIAVWRSAVDIIREHPFIGVGTGDVKDQLMSTYSRNNYMVTLKQKLNAHDQYLQTFIALGLPGILALLAMLAIPGYMAIRRKSFLYRSFLALFAFNILFESMLETQAGVVFYAFFNTLFFWILVNNLTDQD